MKSGVIVAATAILSVSWDVSAEEHARPGFEKFRFEENYGFLNSSDMPPDPFDPFKYIKLGGDPDKYLSLGGSIRERYEYTNNPVFGDDSQDENGVWLQRANLHADMHLGPYLRVFSELSSAIEEGRAGGPSPVDENKLDLQNAFADLSFGLGGNGDMTIRAGRQELEFGSGRLVDTREGTNVRRTFDGFRGGVDLPGWKVDTVAVRPRRDHDGVFDDETNDDEALWGVYAVGQPDLLLVGTLDLYYLGFHDDFGNFVQAVENEKRHTVGARISGNTRGWDWNWEAAYQFGSFGDGDIAAWTLAGDTGFTFEEAPLLPRFGLRANIASGDDDPNDSDLQTFNPLFPRGNYFSQAAVLGPRNFFNVNPHLNLQVTDSFSLNSDVNFYWRLEKNDGVYSPSGQVIREPGGSDARYVATGISVEAVWALMNNVDFTAIYTRLEPGAFIRQTGESKAVDFLELTARFRF
ncbi:alginate export family protein [Thalassospira lucentensis]|nr:alginate export family protein [Thalassospira lucentensis]